MNKVALDRLERLERHADTPWRICVRHASVLGTQIFRSFALDRLERLERHADTPWRICVRHTDIPKLLFEAGGYMKPTSGLSLQTTSSKGT
jgi:hypothetical protein